MGVRPRRAFRLMDLPLFLLLFGLSALVMLVPAIHATVIDAHKTAQAFFYAGLLGLVAFGMIALAHIGRGSRFGSLGPLLSLFCAFSVLPAYLALPFYEALGTTTYLNAYVEMVSAITTTGATLFHQPERLNDALHLWRGLVGWGGGLMMWVAAAAILAPLNLGGFEVTARAQPGQEDGFDVAMEAPAVRVRLRKAAGALIPIYVGLTILLWILLLIGGDRSLVALCHAMAVLATSGISPLGGLENGNQAISGEAVMLLFMLFALSRLTFSKDTKASDEGGLTRDPEFQIGLAVVAVLPILLFLRHWLGAFEVGDDSGVGQALRALWGSMFTVMSFLTTTGFVSSHWGDAQAWSGLTTPGLLLMGLAVIGGGVATTAGGVKLLRVFALYQNGLREMERLVHPSSVSGAGILGRRLQRNGAFIAWIFFMLFAMSIAGVTVFLTAFGVPFETAIVMAVSSLSTTGPLLDHAGDGAIILSEYGPAVKAVFASAMIIGRLETLAIIALLTPDLWRG